jgi:hypothetical protein
MAVARYRDRHTVSRKKSDHGDAVVLANILRTDLAAHRPLPADSELAQAIAVLARAQQDAVWDRTQAHNKLRSQLREYYPAFLHAFAGARDGIACRVVSGELQISDESTELGAFTPEEAEKLPMHPRIRARILDFLAGERGAVR